MPSVPILHVSYDFMSIAEDKIDTFTSGVLASTYGNAAFPDPPITAANLTAALETYTKALAAAIDAGPRATALKNNAKEALLNLLRKVAAYVEEAANNDRATLLSSGFRVASTNRTQHPLPQDVIRHVSQAASGSLLVESATMANVKSWEARWKPEGAPDSAYQHATTLKPVRKLTLINLPALTRVTLQTRGVGGATGYGDWSDAVTHPVT